MKLSIDRRIEGLDELRGIAILLVLLAHFFHFRTLDPRLSHFSIGAIGVDLFFIISGFLITLILIKTRNDQARYRQFYVRRAFRILPLFFVVLAFGSAVAYLSGDSLRSLPFYLTFTQNLLTETPPIGDLLPVEYTPINGLGPMWSLAVEEHTYLLLPMIIFAIDTKNLCYVLAGLAMIGIALKVWICSDYFSGTQIIAYSNPHETWFRMQYICLGGLLAAPNGRLCIAIVSVFWLAISLYFGFGMLELGIALMLVAGVSSSVSGFGRIRNRILARFGTLCYGIYLLHIFILAAVEKLHAPPALALLLFLGACYCIAEVSYRWFELPIQRLRADLRVAVSQKTQDRLNSIVSSANRNLNGSAEQSDRVDSQ